MTVQIEQAVILCGGLGSRLGARTRATPKPLLDVAGTPFLQILIQEIARYGVKRFLLLAAFEAQQIEAFAQAVPDLLGLDIVVEVAIEPERAGTGGALHHARDRLDAAFYLLNGDSLLEASLPALRDLLSEPGVQGALALRHLDALGRYGAVEVDGKTITRFGGREHSEAPAWINGGVYALCRDALDRLTPNSSLEDQLLPLMAQEGTLRALKVDGFFLDIGVPEDFDLAQTVIPDYRRRPAIFFDRDGVLNVDHGHVGTIERFEWIDGAKEAVALANRRGFYVFVVTNQAGIGKGLYRLEDYRSLTRHMRDALAEVSAWIDDDRFCPYHPQAVLPEYRKISSWRKPGPGMILDLMSKWPVDIKNSFMIGNSESDRQAAVAAGVRPLMYEGGRLDHFLGAALSDRGVA